MMTIQEIDKQIEELRAIRDILQKQDDEKYLEIAKRNIGRCFKFNDGAYAKIMGMPTDDFGSDFRKYLNKDQYPALYVYIDEPIPFDKDFIYLSGDKATYWDFSDVGEEVTHEEFKTAFANRLKQFYNENINIKEQ